MGLASFRVIHRLKSGKWDFPFSAAGSFFLDTCQRQLWILHADIAELALPPGMGVFSGGEAYRFLLRVSTGLESQVRGETDIFGQLKQAWQAFEAAEPDSARDIRPWMLKIFEDTKEIRARHLQHVGGESYGSLVRMLLRKAGHEAGPVLIVGAGHIARSIAPWIAENDLWLWNRSAAGLKVLTDDLLSRGAARLRVVADHEIARAWSEAAHVIVCIPLDAAEDEARIRDFEAGFRSGQVRTVIHLGTMREQAGAWNWLPSFFALDDLFALQKAQGERRHESFGKAEKACDEKALLRGLAGSPTGSATLPHGWEDLAAFA
jgi:glutamyl-tRNA reductase